MTLDVMLQRISQEDSVDVFGFVRQMRYQRNFMVQTEVLSWTILNTIVIPPNSNTFSNWRRTWYVPWVKNLLSPQCEQNSPISLGKQEPVSRKSGNFTGHFRV